MALTEKSLHKKQLFTGEDGKTYQNDYSYNKGQYLDCCRVEKVCLQNLSIIITITRLLETSKIKECLSVCLKEDKIENDSYLKCL